MVKARNGLIISEWLWLKLHKKLSIDEYCKTLSDLRYAKLIKEEQWEIDEQGCEIIPSLADKRFFLTDSGKKRLKKLKLLYLRSLFGKYAKCLIWIVKKLIWLIVAAVAFLASCLQILQSLESKGQ